MKNLAPASEYEFKVRAYKDNTLGKVYTVYVATHGQPLIRVQDLHVARLQGEDTTLKVSWLPPTGNVKVCVPKIFVFSNTVYDI